LGSTMTNHDLPPDLLSNHIETYSHLLIVDPAEHNVRCTDDVAHKLPFTFAILPCRFKSGL